MAKENVKNSEEKEEVKEVFGSANNHFDVDFIESSFRDKNGKILTFQRLDILSKCGRVHLKGKLSEEEKTALGFLGVPLIDKKGGKNLDIKGSANKYFDIDLVERSFTNEETQEMLVFRRMELTSREYREAIIKVKTNTTQQFNLKFLGVDLIDKKETQVD